KSIWRGPNAQHFTLVHRSQQDPLLHDAEASDRVLKSTPRRNEAGRSGQDRNELERQLGAIAEKERKNVGEAANYGIYFDDTEYDYMQHLRSIGGKDNSRRGGQDEEKTEDVIMLEAPAAKKEKGKAKATGNEDVLEFKKEADVTSNKPLDLPSDVLPSNQMLPRTFEQDKEEGIRPDMDPHLRQILEALDDDAFLMKTAKKNETEDIDDFFGEIVKGGELEEEEEEPEWRQLPPGGEESIWLDPSAKAARELLQLKEEGKGVEDLSLESRVALFKKAAEENKKQGPALAGSRQAPSSVGSKSIFGDKGASRRSRHAGAKARLASSFYAPSIDGGATAFSMSSSAMERNQGLSKLDEQFARMERIYEQEDDDEDEEEGFEESEDGEDNEVGGPEDVDAIFEDFLSKNEIIGNRLRERLGDQATTPIEKVDMIRRELGEMRVIDRKTYDEAEAEGLGPKTTVEELISRDLAQRANARQEWDVETIQTTKTNLENHPRTIAAAESVAPSRISRIVPPSSFLGGVNGSNAPASLAGTDRMARIKIDPRTGKAVINGYINIGARQARRNKEESNKEDEEDGFSSPDEEPSLENDSASEAGSDDTTTESTIAASRMTVKRDRNESKEEKKARKQAAKEEKQTRKSDKAQRKAQF
ncbi:uncharacterized protein FA14DRAFT_109692, partial [Meira miltonrushii]